MNWQYDVPLRELHTFGVDVKASKYAIVHAAAELAACVRQMQGEPLRLLGGGSNILPTGDVSMPLLHVRIYGRQVEQPLDNGEVLVSAGAGENWHEFVQWCLQQDLGGLENLSLIPGSVGAAPIQNIGAYGVELAEVFDHLEAVDLRTGQLLVLDGQECAFGYRDSFFKREGLGRFAIAKVYFRLSTQSHRIRCDYGAIRDTLRDMGVDKPSIREVGQAVIRIRQSKLPDPAVLGNAGSFFKNPEVSAEQARYLLENYPEMPQYPLPDGRMKVPAGWLIEQCGWKGYREGDAGCYEKQALVLVNYGRATGADILRLAQRIAASVQERFGIIIEPEVNIW